MNEEREAAYLPITLYVIVFVALLVISVYYRQPNPKVVVPLNFPPRITGQ